MTMKFHWYCPRCRRALGIDSESPQYRQAWQGREHTYTHRVGLQEHVLEIVDASQEHPGLGKVSIYIGDRAEICDWMPRRMN